MTNDNFKVRPAVTVSRILLYHPPYKAAHLIVDRKPVELREGIKLWGKTLCTPDGFEQMLLRERSKSGNDEVR